MKWQDPKPLWILSLILVAVFLWDPAWSANDSSRGGSATFFSRGQAVFDPQDQAGSQEKAIRDFKMQAVTQAVGTYLNPSQMGSQFGPLQEKVIKQPEKYVQSYQIFSESPAGGLYRVTGQATVSLDALRQDLLLSGFAVGDEASPPSSPAKSEIETLDNSSPDVAQPRHEEEARPAKSAREEAKFRRKHLWVVPERWSRDWFLPRDRRDPNGLFALTILQECQDYEWTLAFPDSSSIYVDPRGRVSKDEALAEASAMGFEKLVLGTADLVPRGSQDASFAVNLRVLDVSSGKSIGEIHRETDLGDASDQQGAMDMAFAVVPQLDRLLREPSRARESGQAERPATSTQPSQTWQSGYAREPEEPKDSGDLDETAGTDRPDKLGQSGELGESGESEESEEPGERSESGETNESIQTARDRHGELPGGPGEWTLVIRSDHQYAYWEDLARVLLEKSKSMRVRSMEVGGKETKIRIDGIDNETIASIQGTQVREGVSVQVDVLSSETHSLRVTFIRSEKEGAELAQ